MKKNPEREKLKREMKRVSSDPNWGLRYVVNMDPGVNPHLKIKQPVYVVDMDNENSFLCACNGIEAASLITKALNAHNKQEKWIRVARVNRISKPLKGAT